MAHQTCHHKLVLLGETSVGKTCVTIRFVRNEFHEFQEPTIGGTSRKKKNDSQKNGFEFFLFVGRWWHIKIKFLFYSSFSHNMSGERDEVVGVSLECNSLRKKIRNRSEFFGATRLTLLSLSLHIISLYLTNTHTYTYSSSLSLSLPPHHLTIPTHWQIQLPSLLKPSRWITPR